MLFCSVEGRLEEDRVDVEVTREHDIPYGDYALHSSREGGGSKLSPPQDETMGKNISGDRASTFCGSQWQMQIVMPMTFML